MFNSYPYAFIMITNLVIGRYAQSSCYHYWVKITYTTVECRYSAVQRNLILYVVRQWPIQNKNQMLYSQKGTPYLALMGEQWGVFCVDSSENWPRYNSIALYGSHLAKHTTLHLLVLLFNYTTNHKQDFIP